MRAVTLHRQPGSDAWITPDGFKVTKALNGNCEPSGEWHLFQDGEWLNTFGRLADVREAITEIRRDQP